MDAEVGAPPSASAAVPTLQQSANLSATTITPLPNPSSAPTVDGAPAPAVEREDLRGLSDDLGRLLESGLAHDVTFIVGVNKVPIRAHKAILVARSEYFRYVLT